MLLGWGVWDGFGTLGQLGTCLPQSRSRVNTGKVVVFWDIGTALGANPSMPMGLGTNT
jgi:hypothetical protein